MRIEVLTTSFPAHAGDFRGAFVLDLAAALVERGHQVRVVAPHPGLGAAAEEEIRGVSVLRTTAPGRRAQTLFGRHGVLDALREDPLLALELPLSFGAFALGAARAVKEADIIVSNWMIPCGLVGAILSRWSGAPHVAIEHGGGLRLLRGMRLGPRLLDALLANCTIGHFVSSAQRNFALSLLPARRRIDLEERCTVLPMPPAALRQRDGARVAPRSYSLPLKVLYAGRLTSDKGLETLLRAVAATRHTRLTIAGPGPLSARLRAPGLRDRVEILGHVPHDGMPELFARHDVLAVPSEPRAGTPPELAEGVPSVLIHGMSWGVVPVVSRVGGMPEWVRNRETGLVFEPGDSGSLAAHLRFLSSNPRAAATMAVKARAAAEPCTHAHLLNLWRRRGLSLPPGTQR